jgi:23S rRNA (uracil1939-C5)-methyltransferase
MKKFFPCFQNQTLENNDGIATIWLNSPPLYQLSLSAKIQNSMARNRKPLPVFEKVEITDAGAEGKALARVENLVVFVPFVVPGDIVDIKIVKRKKSFLEGKAIKLHQASQLRIEPKCEHFGLCGGCKWQNLTYEKQLAYKQKQVIDNYGRIGKLTISKINPIISSEKEYYYRNKLEFTFSNRRWLLDNELLDETVKNNGLGFHLPGMFDRILDIKNCYLQQEPSNKIRLALREFCLAQHYEFYDTRNHIGFMRNLIIRTSTTGNLMVIVVFGRYIANDIEKVMTFLSQSFPEITSLFYLINTKQNDSINDLKPVHFAGVEFIMENMDDLFFKIGPLSFYQTNSLQALQLYNTVLQYANLSGDEIVYDLYCGTGTISNFVAKRAKIVIGIEYVEAAIEDARENSQLNNIDNTRFFAGDILKVLDAEFFQENGRPDVIITDPPRAGMHPKVIEHIMASEVDKIVYVSCNPATQARDIAMMTEKYELVELQPVDMFPQTHHVENVSLLRRRIC